MATVADSSSLSTVASSLVDVVSYDGATSGAALGGNLMVNKDSGVSQWTFLPLDMLSLLNIG